MVSLIVPQSRLIGTAIKGFDCQMGCAQGLILGMVTVAQFAHSVFGSQFSLYQRQVLWTRAAEAVGQKAAVNQLMSK